MIPVSKKFRTAPALPGNTFSTGNIRIQFITDRLVRFEWSDDKVFEDRLTLAVVNRDAGKVKFSVKSSGKKHTLETAAVKIELVDDGKPFNAKNLNVSFKMGKITVPWNPDLKDRQNLGATYRTLDCCNADRHNSGKKIDLGKGFISRSGWSLIDDSKNIVLADTNGRGWVAARPAGERQDYYLFAYGHDYKNALADAAKVFGAQPLTPRYSLGYWWSRYWAYTDEQIESLVRSFDTMDIPIDVMVIDMDWHLNGWTGYTWDRRYFPDPDEHLAWLHKHGVKVTLNLHPAQGIGKHETQFCDMVKAMGMNPKKTDCVPFDCTDPKFMDHYFAILHHPEEKRGVDFWWMDWQQGQQTKLNGLDPLPWINQLHWEDMERDPAKRPLIFSRFGGYGAGRYNVGFSGDTYSTWESLAYQPYFTSTASNVLYGYWSHDLGGHMPGEIEPELYMRWMQYGIFSPVVRTHTTKNDKAERRFWEYPAPYSEEMAKAVRRRYEMVPYIYSENYRANRTGISLCAPMYYDYPEQAEAYKCPNQYMFGSQMLAAPVVQPVDDKTESAKVKIWLPEGEWFDTARGEKVQGGQTVTRNYMLSEIPVFVRPGTIIPGQVGAKRLDDSCYKNLLMNIYPGESGSYDLYEDDGVSNLYLEGKSAVIAMSHQAKGKNKIISVIKKSGNFKGFESKRTLEVRLFGAVPPKSVKIGGKALPQTYRIDEVEQGWGYCGNEACVIIKTGSFDVVKGLEITVEAEAKNNPALADGLKGLFTRIHNINYKHTIIHNFNFGDRMERLGQEITATANLVSRRPAEFAAAVPQMHKNIADWEKILKDHLPLIKKHYSPEEYERRNAVIKKAANIVKELRVKS